MSAAPSSVIAVLAASLLTAGCTGKVTGDDAPSPSPGGKDPATLTYQADVRSIVEAKCATCHVQGAIAPLVLDSYETVKENAAIIRHAVESGSMPPWPPKKDCNDYKHDRSLTETERKTLLDYFAGPMPEGDVSDYRAPSAETLTIDPSATLKMSEPYTPRVEPDDHRCFVLEWNETTTKYITRYQIVPGNPAIVHHVIAFKIDKAAADQFRAMDDAEKGPGYECFGGPAAKNSSASLQGASSMLAAWAPGAPVAKYPDGSGVEIEAGSVIVLQLHYNTVSANPAPDQTSLEVELADKVERPGVAQLFTQVQWLLPGGMPIPAGDPAVTLETDIDLNEFLTLTKGWKRLGLSPGSDITVHAGGLHMHQFGKWGRAAIKRTDDSEDCIIEIDDWDFNWQGQYRLAKPMTMNTSTDRLNLSCRWDNSAANQPFVDGKQIEPTDLEWGDDTGDEMCLTGLYVTAP